MLFNSLQFLAYFPTVCLVYFCIPQACLRLRNLFLLAASYVFYMGWQPVYALWLLGGTLVTYLSALAIESCHRPRLRLTALCVGILLNGGALFLFKYYDFVAGMLTTALQSCTGADVFPSFPTLGWLLPVGISFYTFQALGYCVDVYRGRTRAERDFFTYALFVAFFPQLVAGPIGRSTHLLPQFRRVHRFDADRLLTGLRLMAWGYLRRFASLCRQHGIRLVWTISPRFSLISPEFYAPLHRLAQEMDIPLLDYHTPGFLLDRPDLFFDIPHLWDRGARLFSARFAHDLDSLNRQWEKE